MVKGNLGPGLLALPIAIKAGGLLVGVLGESALVGILSLMHSIPGLFLLASVTLWCMHLLVNSSHELCKKTGNGGLTATKTYDFKVVVASTMVKL